MKKLRIRRSLAVSAVAFSRGWGVVGVLIGLLLSFQHSYASCETTDLTKAIKIFRRISYAGGAMAITGVVMSGCAVNELMKSPFENRQAPGYLVDGLFLIGVGSYIGIRSAITLGRIKEVDGTDRPLIANSTVNLNV